jgi:murein DD-endopeptidase MepM/ murein hydrolase activator NlpD
MKQEYFVLVLAHSLRGRLRRVHIPHQAVYAVLILAILGCFSVFGFIASYARMVGKVANYNALRRETESLRSRYQDLLKKVNDTDERLASLQFFAKEVTVAYGIKQRITGPDEISAEGTLKPTFAETLDDYDSLREAHILALASKVSHRLTPMVPSQPSIWPVQGRFMGAFGHRIDPFSGEGAFHKGVDISAPTGTTVRATADGIVVFSQFFSGYGRLVIVDHGGGMQTYYAHLSQFSVHVGDSVTRGQEVGLVGSSGRVTAPHLHYEVHLGGSPVNPYPFLARAAIFRHTRP